MEYRKVLPFLVQYKNKESWKTSNPALYLKRMPEKFVVVVMVPRLAKGFIDAICEVVIAAAVGPAAGPPAVGLGGHAEVDRREISGARAHTGSCDKNDHRLSLGWLPPPEDPPL